MVTLGSRAEGAETARGSAAELRIQLLGGFHVWVRGRLIPVTAWRRRKAASLVKLLALAAEHRLNREQVLVILWPELDAEAALNNLHRTLHVTRHILEPDLAPGVPSRFLRLDGEALVLAPSGSLWVDSRAFAAAAAAACRDQDVERYEEALALYACDILPEDRYEDWAADPREELRNLFLDLLRAMARSCEERGEHAGAIEALQRLVASEPGDEEGHVALMCLYAVAGQRAQALQQYQRLRQVLRQELDVEPEVSSQRVYEAILAGRFSSPPLGDPAHRQNAGEDGPALPSPGNLPAHASSFIGHGDELAEVASLLKAVRLLTLTGTGGCGKTRLALEAAARQRDFPHGLWLVELAGLANHRLLPQAVAAALRIREEPHRPIVETLVEYLRSRELLLILDNCEHLLEACSELAGALLQSSPGLRILATSRQALGVSGEVTFRVPSLTMPEPDSFLSLEELAAYDAIRLLLERARSARPGFALTSQNAPAMMQICHQLAGIPLAIELAAGRLKVLSAEQLSGRLDDALSLLGQGSRTALPRQQTLRGAIDWSYGLLTEAERTLLRRLSVFRGGWTLEAAEEIAVGEGIEVGAVLDLLAELVDKSLVALDVRGETARYRLLEPIRQYAAEKQRAAHEAEQVRARHFAWYLALAQRDAMGSGRAAWLDALERELDNLRAALGWTLESGRIDQGIRLAVALWSFWSMRGHLGAGRMWLDTLLARDLPGGPETARLRAKGLALAGVLACRQGDVKRAGELHTESLALASQVQDRRAIAEALANLADVAHFEGDFARAEEAYRESLALRMALGEKALIADTRMDLGRVLRDQGQYAQAMELTEESLGLYRELESPGGVAAALHNLGRMAHASGRYERAQALYRESLALHRRLGERGGVVEDLNSLGMLAQDQGDMARATELFEETLPLRRELGDRWGIGTTTNNLACAASHQGHHERAVTLAMEALDLCRELGDSWGIAIALATMGRVARDQGDLKRAEKRYRESLALHRSVGEGERAIYVEELAGLLCAQGQAHIGALLAGAATARREMIGMHRPPAVQSVYERNLAALRSALGEEGFVTAWEEGKAMRIEEAVEHALALDE